MKGISWGPNCQVCSLRENSRNLTFSTLAGSRLCCELGGRVLFFVCLASNQHYHSFKASSALGILIGAEHTESRISSSIQVSFMARAMNCHTGNCYNLSILYWKKDGAEVCVCKALHTPLGWKKASSELRHTHYRLWLSLCQGQRETLPDAVTGLLPLCYKSQQQPNSSHAPHVLPPNLEKRALHELCLCKWNQKSYTSSFKTACNKHDEEGNDLFLTRKWEIDNCKWHLGADWREVVTEGLGKWHPKSATDPTQLLLLQFTIRWSYG